MVVASAFIMIYVVESFYEAKDQPKMQFSVSPASRTQEVNSPSVNSKSPNIVSRVKNLFSEADFEVNPNNNGSVDFKDLMADDNVHHGLSVAAMTGNLEELKNLLKAGVSPDAKDSFGIRAIARATLWGHYDAVEMLLKQGASVNRQERLGVSLLMLAANQGDEALVNLFLQYGADPVLRSEDGETALSTASKKGYFAIADILRKVSPDEKVTLQDLSQNKEAQVTTEMRPMSPATTTILDQASFVENKKETPIRIKVDSVEQGALEKKTREQMNLAEMPLLASAQTTLSEPATTPSLLALTWAANVSKESIEMVEFDTFEEVKKPQEKVEKRVEKEKKKIVSEHSSIPVERTATIGGKVIEGSFLKELTTESPIVTHSDWKSVPNKITAEEIPKIVDREIETHVKTREVVKDLNSDRQRLKADLHSGNVKKPNFEMVNQTMLRTPEVNVSLKETQLTHALSKAEPLFDVNSRESEIKAVEEKLRNRLPSEEELNQIWNEISRIQIKDEEIINSDLTLKIKQEDKRDDSSKLPTQKEIQSPVTSGVASVKPETKNIEHPLAVNKKNEKSIIELIEESEKELHKITQETTVPQKWSANDFNEAPAVTNARLVSRPVDSSNFRPALRASVYTADDLFKAVLSNAPAQLIQVIGNGVNVDSRGALEMTPLMVAAQDGQTEIVRILLENGAQVNATNIVGQTPIKLASLREHQDIISLLKQYEVRELSRN